jgi:PAS domain-containing protein
MGTEQDALAAGKVAWWTIQLPSGDVTFNPIKAIQLGYDPKDFKHYTDFTDLVHPDDIDRTMQAMRDYIAGKTRMYQCRYRIKDSEGKYHDYMDQGVIQERDGDNISLFGATSDITGMFDDETDT